MTGTATPQLRLVGPEEPTAVPALDEAFRRYSRYVAAVALHVLGREAEVEDLVQDVFLEAHRGWHRIRDGGAVKGWLATVTVRVARRRLRRRRVARALGFGRDYDYATVASADASPEHRTLIARVYEVLDSLPVDQRLAWSLRHLEGEKLERVADLCGCSLATAKRRIGSAHAIIREAVGHG